MDKNSNSPGSYTMSLFRPNLSWCVGKMGSSLPWLLILSSVLLLVDLGGRALWWDEIINVLIDQREIGDIMASLGASSQPPDPTLYIDVHPPLFHLIQHYWIRLAGTSDLAVRLPSVLYALIALYWLHRIGERLEDAATGRLALLIAAISPFWLLYARMARYYALTTMLGLGSTWLYLTLLKRPSRIKWMAYFLVNTAMLYTDYLVATLLVCQAVYLIGAHPSRRWLIHWTASMVSVGLAYFPWLPVWYAQSHVIGGMKEADLAHSLLGTLLKFLFPLFSFLCGETAFPWEVPAILSSLLFAGLCTMGGMHLWRHPTTASWSGSRFLFMILFLAVPLLGTIAVITFLTPTIPFIGIGNRTFFAFPFAVLMVACGLRTIRRPVCRTAILLLLLLVYGYSIYNYFTGRHFLNPIYAVPTETVLADVLSRAQPGDVIYSDSDTGFGYYFEQMPHEGVTHYYMDKPEGKTALQKLAGNIREHRPLGFHRMFLLIYGRNRTRRDLPVEWTKIIEPSAHRIWEHGYLPQEETYRRIKQRLLGYEDYRFKLRIQLYQLPRGSSAKNCIISRTAS